MTGAQIWTGSTWQQYALALLRLRYPLGALIRVPDKHVGDFGLEAFARDGLAFQCYSPDEPISTGERYEKQRNKVTRDIGKLIDPKNLADLLALLNPTQIATWCLLVPICDSALLLRHAAIKAEQVRRKNLAHLTPGFTINVLQESDFPIEARTLVANGLKTVTVPVEPLAPDDITKWAATNAAFVQVLDAKLLKVPTLTTESRPEYRHHLLGSFLVSENILARLRDEHPDIYEDVARCKSEREEWLATTCPVATGPANATLLSVLEAYQQTLTERVRGLDPATADRVAAGTLADWLLRCPVRFP